MPSTTKRIFFGGDHARLGTVRRLGFGSFKDLVTKCLNLPTVLNVTRADYEGASKKQKREMKKTAYITPACFASSPSRRKYETATTISLICLDIDEGKDAKPLFDNPTLVEEQLHPFNFAMYATASSTPENPRIRLLVEADDIPVSAYMGALETIASLIGLIDITKESKVQVQPMFLPSMFRDDDPDENHPLVHFNIEGTAFTEKDVKEGLKNIHSLPSKKKGNSDDDELVSVIEFLRAPVEGITTDIARQALEHIDPDVEYYKWFKVCLALRHQFYGKEEDEGYRLFDEWSSKGEKYVGPEETRAKWESCDPHARSREPVTVRSLLRDAHDAGWDSKDVIQDCADRTSDFISGCKSARELLTEGIKRVATTPLLTPGEDDALLHKIGTKLKELEHKVTLSTLKSELKKMRAKLTFEKAKKDVNPPWTKGIIYVTHLNQFCRHTTGETWTSHLRSTSLR